MIPLSVLVQPGGGSGIDGSGSTVLVNPSSSTLDPSYVTFKKADYSSTGTRGGPSPTYPTSVTMSATAKLYSVPTRLLESNEAEPRPLSKTSVQFVTGEDPATYLGASLATNDLADWDGKTFQIVGTSIYQSGAWTTLAEFIG